ncbi:MAG: hypothetical protein HDT38_03240 [Clostridiales bacterium]|nr:hypothetical protein [Clostridiales bacterium]
MGDLFKKQDSAPTQADSAAALAAPQQFTLDAQGNFSFEGVENADYYLIYLCDTQATEDGDSYLYSSEMIAATESNASYTGALGDIVDYAYGDYLAKVFAFPALGDSDHAMSSAATAAYTFSGTQHDPEVAYFWNTFDNTMGVQLLNIGDYTYEAYPDQVDVTFTNVNNSSDVVTVTLEGLSPDNCAASTSGITRGETYRITAVSTSESPYVTNPVTQDITVAEAVTCGEVNAMVLGYVYADNIDGEKALLFPRVCERFDLANGGSAGEVSARYGQYSHTATPTGPNTYDILIDMRMFNADTIWSIPGTLELHDDGTLTLRENGWGPVPSANISGIWVDNGDGTAALSYDPATVVVA